MKKSEGSEGTNKKRPGDRGASRKGKNNGSLGRKDHCCHARPGEARNHYSISKRKRSTCRFAADIARIAAMIARSSGESSSAWAGFSRRGSERKQDVCLADAKVTSGPLDGTHARLFENPNRSAIYCGDRCRPRRNDLKRLGMISPQKGLYHH